jgi:hypothetical protein
MVVFDHEIEFTLGPSCGFNAPKGSIHTCDMHPYVRVDNWWYSIKGHEVKRDELIEALKSPTNELEFIDVMNQLQDEKITRHCECKNGLS